MQLLRLSPLAVARLLLIAACAAGTAGCVSFPVSSVAEVYESLPVSSVTEAFEKEEPVVAPNSMAAVWTTTVLEKQAAPTTRGFGGVVTFYKAGHDTPVRVNGDLTVYAYNETLHSKDEAAPDRKYIFRRDQLEKHFEKKGPTGPTYHIWLPWDEVGGPRQEVSLILRFDPAEGKAVMSNSSRVVLPGEDDGRDRVWASRTSQVTRVSHEEPIAKPPCGQQSACPVDAEPKMKVMTLDLPRHRWGGTR